MAWLCAWASPSSARHLKALPSLPSLTSSYIKSASNPVAHLTSHHALLKDYPPPSLRIGCYIIRRTHPIKRARNPSTSSYVLFVLVLPPSFCSSVGVAAFQIASPADGATVSGSWLFRALDGNQSDEYYAQASLKDTSTGKETTIVSRRRFDGYVVEAQVDASGFAKGSYRTLCCVNGYAELC